MWITKIRESSFYERAAIYVEEQVIWYTCLKVGERLISILLIFECLFIWLRMKNVVYILTTLLLLLVTDVSAQRRDKDSQEKFIYTDVIAKYSENGYLRGFELDFGVLVDTTHTDIVLMRKRWEGVDRQFESPVDAYNFMGQEGWEFVQMYISEIQPAFSDSKFIFYHWIFKKRVNDYNMMKK